MSTIKVEGTGFASYEVRIQSGLLCDPAAHIAPFVT